MILLLLLLINNMFDIEVYDILNDKNSDKYHLIKKTITCKFIHRPFLKREVGLYKISYSFKIIQLFNNYDTLMCCVETHYNTSEQMNITYILKYNNKYYTCQKLYDNDFYYLENIDNILLLIQ